MTELRRSYDMLMMKVLSLLQDSDQKLASAIVSSREAIWGLLADPNKFNALQI
jgi:biotin operon repressor